ncbi:MAG: hypothetical protein JRH07_11460, partial [Deltaproteobacteria bacterium]|nr:hypothetical protein [Deltaproteobacteria bacterium]
MPIPLPNLDDRTFTDLVEEMRALIPRYAPAWTDHNVSDPGITLVELFAWLAEALIYRLNRIPEASEVRFLELLGADFRPAEPASVTLAVTAQGLEAGLTLPRETPLVAESGGTGEPLHFETVRALRLTPENPGGLLEARQTTLIRNERLGTANGMAHQVFSLARPFVVLDPSDLPPQVPEVRVEGEAWLYRPSLVGSMLHDPHFTVEPRLGVIRFGGGNMGRVPQEGAEIISTYRSTLGRGGRVPGGTEFRIDQESDNLDQGVKAALDSGVSLSIFSKAESSGAMDPTGIQEARDQAARALRKRWRAVRAEDFEELILEEAGLNIARVNCLAERDLTSPDPDLPRHGHVSLVVVPNTPGEKPKPTADCIARVWRLLDERRLITCRHHVLGPEYTDMRIRACVVRK